MSRFDDILGAAGKHQGKNSATRATSDGDSKDTRLDFWSAMEKPKRSATIKLSVSVPLPLNDQIEEKARSLGISKNELINKMLEYLLS